MQKSFLDGRVLIKTGDLTKEKVLAIVNAANSSLMGGGGVDGAIHKAGGEEILRSCREIREKSFPNGLPTGKAVITTAGKLPCKYVIHTVGPIWNGGKDEEDLKLANCYRNSLRLAIENNASTIAFPAISTGVYAFPKARAAQIASRTISNFIKTNNNMKEIRLLFFAKQDYNTFIENASF